jgi:hypothetical protein
LEFELDACDRNRAEWLRTGRPRHDSRAVFADFFRGFRGWRFSHAPASMIRGIFVFPILMEYAESFQNRAQGTGLSRADSLRILSAMPEEGELHPEFQKSNIHPSRMRS